MFNCLAGSRSGNARKWRKRLAANYVYAAVMTFAIVGTRMHSQPIISDTEVSAGSGTSAGAKSAGEDTSLRPFHVHFSDEALTDLHQRLVNTHLPDKELVPDQSQGVQLKTMKELVQYWQTDYDWRKAEAKLNAVPEYVTTIDGVDIQFIWVRSKQPNALPIIITHGWPGSIIEQLKVIGPLTDPTAHGGTAED